VATVACASFQPLDALQRCAVVRSPRLGLRVGEACALRVGDVDQARRLLIVRAGKFGKSRLVLYGPRIGELLAHQLSRRAGSGPLPDEAPLFTFNGRTAVSSCGVSQTFRRVAASLQLSQQGPVSSGCSRDCLTPAKSPDDEGARPRPFVVSASSAALAAAHFGRHSFT
jgi:Phage integrase family